MAVIFEPQKIRLLGTESYIELPILTEISNYPFITTVQVVQGTVMLAEVKIIKEGNTHAI